MPSTMTRPPSQRMTAALLLFACFQASLAAELVVSNRLSHSVELMEPQEATIPAGDTLTFSIGRKASFEEAAVKLRKSHDDDNEPYSETLPPGTQRYAVLVLEDSNENGSIVLYDTNDLQVELSAAAHRCVSQELKDDSSFENCLSEHTFGGMPIGFVKGAFHRLWDTQTYWSLCNHQAPAEALREIQSKLGHTIEILREEPKVATIRGFVSQEGCADLMKDVKENLSIATVGGVGKTETSESRETLTDNVFIDWDTDDIYSRTAAATFDVASELLQKRVPYEGQEPINFLHYIKGYEYKPHTDGSGYKLGDRVATTLIYCETAEEGGGTVFPYGNQPMRFQPNPGDLLYFEYQPNPNMALHAACPVTSGSKSTFTQWHRLGVSPEKQWWEFENWGRFENPFIHTRWRGPRYGDENWEQDEL